MKGREMVNQIVCGDALTLLKTMDKEFVDCCVTSPPYYGLRDYGVEGQLGLEKTPEEYVAKVVEIFGEVKRVLKPEGTLWLNLGDSYVGSGRAGNKPVYFGKHKMFGKVGWDKNIFGRPQPVPKGLKPKDLIGIPWRVALALQADGWYLRQDIIWHKPNPTPESVTDRPTRAHEYIFLLSRSGQYYYDYEAISEACVTKENRPFGIEREREYNYKSKHLKARGFKTKQGSKEDSPQFRGDNIKTKDKRNKRSVWTIATQPFKEAHFAVFPPKLIEPCILAGCPENGIVLDPFMGSGTTAMVAIQNQRNFIGFELNKDYIELTEKRIHNVQLRMQV